MSAYGAIKGEMPSELPETDDPIEERSTIAFQRVVGRHAATGDFTALVEFAVENYGPD